MKTKNTNKKYCIKKFSYAPGIKILMLYIFVLAGILAVHAQDSIQYTKPTWFFGIAAGGNINFYRGSTQQLNTDLTVPATIHNGDGIGLFIAPLIEYRSASSRWGITLQAGYDSRKGAFNTVQSPCNCPEDLNTDLSYLTVEPSIRFAPFKSGLYLFVGPRVAFEYSKEFTYKFGLNPDATDQEVTPDVNSDFSSIRPTILSMQVGAGYDIPLTQKNKRTQLFLSPFVSFHPYFGQNPRSVETWNITTLRVGAALKLGSGHKIKNQILDNTTEIKLNILEPEVIFTVTSPANIVAERKVYEIFPIRNYVFFDLGYTDISSRYVLLTKDQAATFKETDLAMITPKNMSGRSERQMIVYYNVLNILGDRMSKNPASTVTLVGSSAQGNDDAQAMAESVKKYLVTIFEIAPSRISTEGRNRPILPSGQIGGTKELTLLKEGDRRVSIETQSPELLMEFQNGPNTPLKPVAINVIQVAPLDSYVTFNVPNLNKSITSWSLKITDEAGVEQFYGPYTEAKVSIPGKTLLGTRPMGDFKVEMIAKTKTNKVIIKNATAHVVLWSASTDKVGMRFSILYEFNKSVAIDLYRKYLIEVIIPKIPNSATIVIHGHTDIIGDPVYNQQLSIARANDVQNILQYALNKAGRTDVKFEVYGFGNDQKMSPFENKYPEERFYNRTVIIDIVP